MLEEIKNIKTGKKDLRSFGVTIGIILIAISGFLFFKGHHLHRNFLYTGSSFIGLGLIVPIILKPLYLIWMVFAVLLGWVMTRVILSLLFYLIITPIGLLGRLFGKDFLDVRDKSHQNSYWNKRDSQTENNQDYTKQF